MTTKNIKFTSLIAIMVAPYSIFAQEAATGSSDTYFSNPLFNALLATSLILAFLIVALGGVLKNISNSDWLIKKYSDKNDKPNITSVLIIGFSLVSMSAFAQDIAPVKEVNDWLIGGLDQFTFYFMATLILLELIVIGLMINLIKGFVRKEEVEAESIPFTESKVVKNIMSKLSDAVDVEHEADILLDHDYDGIKELDNNLPPWWKYGFYLTIIVGVVYLVNYHVLRVSPLQAEEYTNSVKQAELEIAEFMKNSANNVDETTVKMLDNQTDLDAGKDLFMSNCAACHGKLGEGTVGPNLTDNYWVHGGSIQDIFKTIKYGWPDKGMKSWKEDFSPMQIAQLTSYLKTLVGTNPPNGKAAQGDLYTDSAAPANDSTVIVSDTLKVVSVTDSVSVPK
jgi:cytochrome c oxidase cbb3-type subunit 3